MANVRPRLLHARPPTEITAPARPMVVAHRGASFDVAEHTLAAYRAAIESGADALECDVRLTRDGHLVCVHDRTVNRTSNGRGVVSDLDLPTLTALDFSSWHGRAPVSADELLNDTPYLEGVTADRIERGGGVLTLELLLQLVHDADRDVRLLIETKHPTRYGGLVEQSLVEQLARFGWAGRRGPPEDLRQPSDLGNPVVVMSFATVALRRVRLLAPDVPTVKLYERIKPKRRAGLLPNGVPIAGPDLELLRTYPEIVANSHANGHPVYVWTVDDLEDVRFVVELGVDTIITDRPREVGELLDNLRPARA